MRNDRSDAGGYMGWFLFGAVLGAGFALLMTPKTGAQARELLAERGAHDRDLRGRAVDRGARGQQHGEGDAARPAAVLRPVGLLPGQGDPRAPVSRPEDATRGSAGRALPPEGPRARQGRGARGKVCRGGEALQHREEGDRSRSQEARGGARPPPSAASVLRVRRGAPADRDRERVGGDPLHLTPDILVLAGPGGPRRGAHRERLRPDLLPVLPAPPLAGQTLGIEP